MSYLNSNQQIQKFVLGYGNRNRTYKVINAVLESSNANTAIKAIDSGWLNNGPGKLRTAKVTYRPILCDQTGDCNATLCSEGTPVEPKQVNYSLTRCTSSPVYAIDKDDIRMLDTGWDFSTNALDIIGSALPDIRRQHATALLTLLSTYAGCHVDGQPRRRVNLSNPTNGFINPTGKYQIEREFTDGGFEMPFILGNYEVDNWIKGTRDIGGLNAGGQQIGRLGSTNMYYDGLVDNVLTAENGGNVLAWDPRMLKYVSFSKNSGIFSTGLASIEDIDRMYQRGGTNYIEGSFYDDVTGLIFDFYARYDECNERFTFQIKHLWDLLQMPEVACNEAECVNGIFWYNTCPEVLADCPTGDPVVNPLASSGYQNTPGDIYPFNIYNLEVDGRTTTPPNIPIEDIDDLIAALNDGSGTVGFFKSTTNIRYRGYNAITVKINGGASEGGIDLAFTLASPPF